MHEARGCAVVHHKETLKPTQNPPYAFPYHQNKTTTKQKPNKMEELKPGQKFPTPTPGMGDRVFYETLLRQRPDSEMAQEWCVAYGVLEDDEAAKLFKIITKRKKSGKSSGSTPTPVKKKSSAGGSKKKAKIIDDVGYDAGMQSGGAEGIGAAAL